MRTIFFVFLMVVGLLPYSCVSESRSEKEVLTVSIAPLKKIVQSIVEHDFEIDVLVPAGVSPETFELTPRRFSALNQSKLIFSVGLIPFEQSLLSKLSDQSEIVYLSQGIELVKGACGHHHHEAVGVDPHVWTSPRALIQMAENAYDAIHRLYPDSTRYSLNYKQLNEELWALDRYVTHRLSTQKRRCFIIYHPALTYYARDYSVEQIAIEKEGKEPSAKQLARLIEQARRDSIKTIFYQSQLPHSSVEIIASDIDAEMVAVDPLKEDVLQNIKDITDLISE